MTSSQDPGSGWVPQAERLTAAQVDVTDLTGFTAANTTIVRSTTLGHDGSDSLEVTPAATGTTVDTRVAVGGDLGAMRLGMQTGRRYRMTGWIYVPSYDTGTQLRAVWDPRLAAMGKPVLKTLYTYDAAGRLATVSSPGETQWAFTYAGQYAAPLVGMPNPQRVSQVSRGGAATVANATASTPGPDGYPTASVHYLDVAGREVNTATPGGYIDTTEYDRFGNEVRSLAATNRMTALGQGPDAARWLAELGLDGAGSVTRSRALDAVTSYTPDGVDVLATTGPVRSAVLEADVADPDGAGPLTAIPAGTTVVARAHAVTVYDEGKPDAAKYHLPTTERVGATLFGYDPAYPDVDARVVTTAYDPVLGGTSGWTVRKETRVTVDPGAGGANVTSAARYDSAGRAVESRKVDSAGGDARTTVTVFWTAGANPDLSDGARCGSRPEWAGQPCVTRPGGTVTGSAPAQLPTRFIQEYSRTGDTRVVVETANGQTRTTTTGYDAADRVTSVAISGTAGAGTAVDTVYSGYDDATGDLVDTFTKNTSGVETGRVHRVFDVDGRLQSYTDADAGSTATTFDQWGRPQTVTASMVIAGTTVPAGSKTFAYDLARDPRGVVTSVTDSVAGTVDARYGPDGEITSQTYPGGITQATTYDAAGAAVARSYTAADGTLVYTDQVVTSTHGQWAQHSYNGASRTYTYDRMGRLTGTSSVAPGADTCTLRGYGYDHRANRTSRTVTGGATTASGGCQASADPAQTTTQTHIYDAADRLTDTGFGYDAFGRTTTLPAATAGGGAATLTNGFSVNDLIASQTLDGTRRSWALDPGMRARSFTTETLVGGVWANAATRLNHYDGDSDEPSWVVEDTSQGVAAPLTRMVEGLDGGLAATTSATGDVQLQLVNLHGDVAVELAADLTTLVSRFFDEFGVPEAGTPAGSGKDRYGWLGGAQRSGEALGDVLLMGVRLYSPGLGRFLQTDPVPDGNASAYDYCNADPVNCTDLDGRWGWRSFFAKVAKVAEVASWIPGPIGSAAAAVSSIAYAVSGNKAKALEMGLTAAAALVGAGAAVRAGFKAVRAASKAQQGARATKTIARLAKRHAATSDARLFKKNLSQAEILAVGRAPYLRNAFRGTAVHRATARSAKYRPSTWRYEYETRGPDFVNGRTGHMIELTTYKSYASHLRRGGACPRASYALYAL